MSANRVLTTSRGTNLEAFSTTDWLFLGTLGLIWGSSFLFMAIGLDSFHPGLVSFIRVLVAALFFFSLPGVRSTRIDRGDWPRLIVLSITWVAIPFTLFPIAQQWISSGTAGMLNGSTPIFAAIIASILLRRMPGRLQTVGLLVGLAGVVLITYPAAQDSSNQLGGVLLALLASALYGVAINLAVPALQKYGSLPVMGRMMWISAPLVAPFGIYALGRSGFSAPSLIATMAVGLLGTGLAFILAGKLASRVGSTRSSFTAYLIPVVALILGWLVRDEVIAPLSILGIALVLSGAFLASRKET